MSREHGVNWRKVLYTPRTQPAVIRFVPCGRCENGWVDAGLLFERRLTRCECWLRWRDAVNLQAKKRPV